VRRVTIVISCDACEEDIREETEGDSRVSFTVRGEERELDLCDDCLGGTFLQEARPVRKQRGKIQTDEFYGCDFCGKTFGTARGLSMHQTRQAHN